MSFSRELLAAQVDEIYAAFPERPPMLTLHQTARYLRRDERSLISDGTFPMTKRGRAWSVPVLGLAKWILEGTR